MLADPLRPARHVATAAPAASAGPSRGMIGGHRAGVRTMDVGAAYDGSGESGGTAAGVAAPAKASAAAKRRSLAARLIGRLLEGYGGPPVRVVLWSGEEVAVSDEPPLATVRLRDRRVLLELLCDPDLAFGDAYSAGRIDVEGDLARFLESVFASAHAKRRRGLPWPALPRLSWLRDPIEEAKRNIHHHYDVGNDFYRLWLDERLVYTCAYFPDPAASLEDAQLAKMDHVCRKLALRPGEDVVEAGCGWGSLALHMAERYGVRVRAYNLSSAQIAHARQEARRRGLEGRVSFVEDDYRNITGRYDAFVSVGMLEHVGRRHYPTLGRVIARALKPDGRGLLHSIGRARPQRMNRWLVRRIFPGAYIPSLKEMMDVCEAGNLAVLDVENLRLHYARTLEHWLERLERAAERIRAAYDERLVRAYRLYLASSMAAFRTGSCHLYQVVFSRAGNNRIPWTRAHVYGAD